MESLNADRRRLIDTLEQIGPGDHLCLIYETREEEFAVVIPFVRIGLERGEKCIYIADDNTTGAVLDAMRSHGIDVDSALRARALIVTNKQKAYLKQGYFQPDSMICFLTEATDAAKAAGFSALRVTGEMTWALGDNLGVERLIEYEAKLNCFFPESDCLAICQYNRRRFSPETILDVIRTHPIVIRDDRVCKNFYYVPADEFLSPNQSARKVERLLTHIKERGHAEEARKKARDELEIGVLERTADFQRASEQLKAEIMERKRAEDEKARLEEQLRSTLLDGIVTIDHNGTVLTINSAAALLLSVIPEEAIGTSLREFCRGRVLIADVVEKALDTGELVREYEVSGYNGGRRWNHSLSVMPLARGTEEGAVLVIRDVSRLRTLEREVADRFSFENIIGKSPSMMHIFEMIRHLADTDTTVLIQGPSGTGKELVAAALHYHSVRHAGPLVKVSCSALPDTLLESELFGHVRGAFTGATENRVGRFELAHGGTIFLDEVGDISPSLQKRLLRVLQEREIERVGSSKTIKINVRVVAATNCHLSELVSRGVFREDLYYRLNVVTIHLPPLCERREDIPLMIRYFLDKIQLNLGRVINGMDPVAMEMLIHYDWPGNVRQLENALERAVVLCRDGYIRPENLPPELAGSAKTEVRQEQTIRGTIESRELQQILDSVGWNRSRAAKRLGVHRNTVSRRIKEYGLVPPLN